MLKLLSGKYPAHMHIDIDSGYTGGGNGTAMVNLLLSHLKSLNVKGVMLIAGSANTGAVRFYKRFGFKTLLKACGAQIRGLKFS